MTIKELFQYQPKNQISGAKMAERSTIGLYNSMSEAEEAIKKLDKSGFPKIGITFISSPGMGYSCNSNG